MALVSIPGLDGSDGRIALIVSIPLCMHRIKLLRKEGRLSGSASISPHPPTLAGGCFGIIVPHACMHAGGCRSLIYGLTIKKESRGR